MEKELSFQRKISFEPLLISIFFGVIITTIVYSIIPNNPLLWIISGIMAFVVESMLIYPRYFVKSYGYWKINKKGIYYYDYSSWKKKVKAIFFPTHEKSIELPYKDIRAFSVVDGKSIMNTQYPLGGSFKAPLARKIHCLVIRTEDNEIKLNCAWKTTGIPTTNDDIDRIVELLNSQV